MNYISIITIHIISNINIILNNVDSILFSRIKDVRTEIVCVCEYKCKWERERYVCVVCECVCLCVSVSVCYVFLSDMTIFCPKKSQHKRSILCGGGFLSCIFSDISFGHNVEPLL